MIRLFYSISIASILLFIPIFKVYAIDYYISPIGNDQNSGLSTSQPWRTFAYASASLKPGDNLILMDGIYYEELFPVGIWGTAENPITIKAMNDGKAIIDAEFKRRAIYLASYAFENQPAYLVLEGITARNGEQQTIFVGGAKYITFKRIHAYDQFMDFTYYDLDNPPPHALTHPIHISRGENILLEDVIASGFGSKTLKIIGSSFVTARRVLVDWRYTESYQDFNAYPWSGGLNIYHAANNLVENSVVTGTSPMYGINIHGDESGGTSADGNKYLGNIILNMGYTRYDELYDFGTIRPQPSFNAKFADRFMDFNASSYLGFGTAAGTFRNTLWQDMFIFGNGGYGFHRENPYATESSNNLITNTTMWNNNRHTDNSSQYYLGNDTSIRIEKSLIQNDQLHSGPGADVSKRYIEGIKTNEDLWPWPMEQRVRDELGYSVTNMVADAVNQVHPGQINRIDSYHAPILATDKTALIFPLTALGSSVTESIVVSNKGDSLLELESYRLISEMTIPNPDANLSDPIHELDTSTCHANMTLYPGDTCTIDIEFRPTDLTYYSGRLVLTPGNMGSVKIPHIVNIVGIGSPNTSLFSIPGRIQAEYYSAGYDTTQGDRYNQRVFADEVDVRISRDIEDSKQGFEVWSFRSNEWVEYLIDVAQSGNYYLNLRYTSARVGNIATILIDNDEILSADLSDTGGWENYTTTTLGQAQLSAGTHTLRIKNTAGDFVLNYIDISENPAVLTPNPAPPQPGDVDGDLDVDYHDYFTLIGHFLSTTFSAGDFKLDGIIDIFDFNLLIENFGRYD